MICWVRSIGNGNDYEYSLWLPATYLLQGKRMLLSTRDCLMLRTIENLLKRRTLLLKRRILLLGDHNSLQGRSNSDT